MAQLHCEGAALHHGLLCIRPLVSLAAFAPCSSPQRATGTGSRGQHRANVSCYRAVVTRASGNMDPNMVRDLARLMPDPAGSDDLLAPDPPYAAGPGGGWGYSGGAGAGPDARMQDAYNDLLAGSDLLNTDSYIRDMGDMYVDPDAFYERLAQLLPELQRQELQRLQDEEVRQEWEIEQAQENAMALHHKQMENASSRYEMALRLGAIMEELSQHDFYARDGQDVVPPWVRAHFILEQELAQQRAGEDPASIHHAAVKQQAGGESLDRPLDDILPGADTQETIEAYLDEIIGAKPSEQATYAAAEYTDEDAGDALEEDNNAAFETGTADEEAMFQGLGPMPQSELKEPAPEGALGPGSEAYPDDEA